MDNRSRLARAADRAAYAETSPFQAAEPEPLLTRAIPVSAQLPRYRVPSARRDLVAGVTVAALALPAAMAYAEVAGLRAHEITLVVARLRTRMEEQLDAAGVTETIGSDRFYPSVRAAVAACVSANDERKLTASPSTGSTSRR